MDFGEVDPAVIMTDEVQLSVNSNKRFDLTKSLNGAVVELGLSTSLLNQSDVLKGAAIPFTDVYTIDVPWTTDPGGYTAQVTYTVVQD